MIALSTLKNHLQTLMRSQPRKIYFSNKSTVELDALGLKSSERALRVLMVTPRYFPLMGGVESHIYEVGRRLHKAGVAVTVLTVNHDRKQSDEEVRDGIRIRRVAAWPKGRDYCLAPAMYKVITGEAWDVIHLQGCHTFVPLLGMFAARRAGLPYTLTFHTGGHSSGWRNRIRKVQWQVLRPFLRRAERLVGVSRFEVELFQKQLKLSPEKFRIIPNGGRLPEPVEVPAAKATSDEQPLIISVGRLEHYKGHHRAIAALPQVLERHPQAKLLILGSGPYERELRQLAVRLGVSDRVEIRAIPPSQRQEMAYTVSQAALVVLFSEYEAHPVSVMEALALKRPVLVADTSGLHELAERGLVRAIPLQSEPKQAAEAILAQLEDPFIPTQNLELPTWEECADRLLELYHEIARQPLCV